MLWEHILERKNVSILIDKDPFRLVLRILKVFKLIQKYVAQLIAIKKGEQYAKRGAVCQNHVMDQNQDLSRTLEICVCLSSRL